MTEVRPTLQAIYDWVEYFSGRKVEGIECLNLAKVLRHETESWREVFVFDAIEQAAITAKQSVREQAFHNHSISEEMVADAVRRIAKD